MNAIATTPVVTPDDLLRMPNSGKGYELVDGTPKELAVSFLSSYVAGRVFKLLDRHVEAHGDGWALPEGTSYRCFPADPNRVRRPDVSFIALDRYDAPRAATEGHCTVAPDLAVEVVSPHDLAYEVDAKIEDWLAAGVHLVWAVYPETRLIRASLRDGSQALFRSSDTLTAEPVLPGFSCPAADLFRLPGGAAAGVRPPTSPQP